MSEKTNFKNWENIFSKKIKEITQNTEDSSHDFLHFKRVVDLTNKLSLTENANTMIAMPAAWLHDLINVPKNSPLRNQASKLSADAAILFLTEINYPKEYYADIHHAIEGHSFSANIEIKTLEAKIVQDADRLDGLGSIGIARCFSTAGLLKRSFYSEADPFCNQRTANDSLYTLDHFYKKLFLVADQLKTESGKKEGQKRLSIMKDFLTQLETEI